MSTIDSLPLLILFLQIFILFFISRVTIEQIFLFFYPLNSLFVALIFFPGTVVHELAHFFMCAILFVRTQKLSILPEREKGNIRLGSVVREEVDFLRGILIGLAPIFAGLFFFWWLSIAKIFPSSNLLINIILIYLMFAISTTMFSSREDLKELINLIPLIILIVLGIYLFDIDLSWQLKIDNLRIEAIKDINLYLFYSILINILIIGIVRGIMSLRGKLIIKQ